MTEVNRGGWLLGDTDNSSTVVKEGHGEDSAYVYESCGVTCMSPKSQARSAIGKSRFPKAQSHKLVIDDVDVDLFPYTLISELRLSQIEVNLIESTDDPANPPNCFVMLTRKLHSFDLWITTPIHTLTLGVLGDWFVVIWAQAFSVWFVSLTLVLTCFVLSTEYGMTLVVSGILTPIFNSTLKGVFLRSRPDPKTIGIRSINLRRALKNHSFPSGDSAEAGCWGASVAIALKSKWPLLVIPLTMFARVYYGAHYVGDTIVGAALGALIAIIVSSMNGEILANLDGEENWFPMLLVFAIIPTVSLSLYYLLLCAKGLR